MQEKWRSIKDYEESYVISNRWRVRSLDRAVIAKNGQQRRMRGKVLKPLFNSETNEPYVNLQKDGNSNFKTVLKILTETFDISEIDFSVEPQELVVGWPDTY